MAKTYKFNYCSLYDYILKGGEKCISTIYSTENSDQLYASLDMSANFTDNLKFYILKKRNLRKIAKLTRKEKYSIFNIFDMVYHNIEDTLKEQAEYIEEMNKPQKRIIHGFNKLNTNKYELE